MAKKKVLKDGELPDVMDMMKSVDPDVESLGESSVSKIDEWIPTGNYLLNACISGSLFKGFPSGKVTTLCGASQSGKSFLATSMAREAQARGYNVLVIDTEGNYSAEFVKRIGCDPHNHFMIKQVNTVLEVNQLISSLCAQEEKLQEEYGQHHKFCIILDSLGNLASNKEIEDGAEGRNSADMSKAKHIRSLFRCITVPLSRLQWPLIVVNQIYASLSMYSPGNTQSGGLGIAFNSSVTLELFPSKLQDKSAEDATKKAVNSDDVVKSGVLVTCKPQKSRFCIPRKIRFAISFHQKSNPYVGLEAYLKWENSQICRGTMLTDKEWEKLGGDSKTVHTWEYNGQTLHCQEKETARGIVVGHLGKTIGLTELWTDEVFTDEFLHKLDETVIRPAFELPEQSSFDVTCQEIENFVDVGDDIEEE